MSTKITKIDGLGPGTLNGRRFCLQVENERTGIPKTCIHDYACRHCPFDQWMDVVEERYATEWSFKIGRKIQAGSA